MGVFDGNTDSSTIVTNSFRAVWTQHVRLHPLTFNSRISLRWELHGCAFGYACPLFEGGDVSADDVIAGNFVQVSCDSGFQLSTGAQQRRTECRNGGVWSLAEEELECQGESFYETTADVWPSTTCIATNFLQRIITWIRLTTSTGNTHPDPSTATHR